MINRLIRSIVLLLITSFSYCICANAQEKIIITGQIKGYNNEPLPYSDVLITKQDSSKYILAFDVADKNGNYKIELVTKLKFLQIEAVFMGYNKGVKKLLLEKGKLKYVHDFILEFSTEEIEEVKIVSEKPLYQIRQDTTYFNLAKIRDSTEVVVEDLIRKLPGVTVLEDGRIKFKGKKVTNVLLDGDDLFEGNYTLGTKNIQADHVEGISAVENYTNNPLLRGVEITEDVALNLKFRSGLSLSHNLRTGIGSDKRYSITHKAIAITKKVKAFSLLDHNTLGGNAGQGFFNPGSYINRIANNNRSGAPNFLGLSMSATQGERNNSFFGSINILPHITETFKARLNIDYFRDKAESEHYSKQIVTVDPLNPIVIEQSNEQIDFPRFFNGKLLLEKYLSKNIKVDNTSIFSVKRNLSNNSAIQNKTPQQFDKSINDHYFKNMFVYTQRLSNGSSMYLNCDISSNESQEELLIMPGIDLKSNKLIDEQLTIQNIRSKKDGIELRGMFLVSLFKKHKINVGFNGKFYKTSLNSTLNNIGLHNDFSNEITYRIFVPNMSLNYEYKYNKIEIRPKINLKLYNYSYENKISYLENSETNLLADVSLGIKYKFIYNHELLLNINSSAEAPDDSRIYDNYILTSNRLLKNNKISFKAQETQNAHISYCYNSMLTGFGYSIGANYNRNNYSYQTDYIFDQDITYQTSYLSDNGASGYALNANLNVKIGKILERIGIKYSYSSNEFYNSVNSEVAQKKNNNRHYIQMFIQTKVFWNLYIENQTSYNRSVYFSENIKLNDNESLSSKFSLYFNLFNRINVKAFYTYVVPSLNNFNNNNQSLNATLRFISKKKNIIFMLEGRNLINQKSNNLFNTNEYSETISYSNLQRRYFLFSVEVRF